MNKKLNIIKQGLFQQPRGHGIAGKLEALGIRQGQEIKKISDQWMRGPVLLQHGHSQLALGFGMASKVLVEITGGNK